MNMNGNRYLSLAEVDKGIRDVLGLEEVFDCKAAVNYAFHFTKNSSPGESKFGEELLEFRELRLFLQTLRATFEFYQGFNKIDAEGDSRISKEEFCSEEIVELLGKWTGGEIEDIDAEFDAIDTNQGGMILFKVRNLQKTVLTFVWLQEFCDWAFAKDFDLEDDIDSQADDEEEEG